MNDDREGSRSGPAQPLLTVGVPVRNGAQYIRKTLDSILDQDFRDFVLLVSDNASDDSTREIVRDYMARDDRVRLLVNARNEGAAQNYNRLVHEATTPYFKWASADDVCAQGYLRRCVAALEADPARVLAYPRTVLMDADGTKICDYEDRLDLQDPSARVRLSQFAERRRLCNACFGVMRRDVMLATGLIRPTPHSDITFLAEMLLLGRFAEVAAPLFWRRKTKTSAGLGKLSARQVREWFAPQERARRLPPMLGVFWDIEKAIVRSPLKPRDRIATAVAFAAAWAERRLRVRFGLVRRDLHRRRPARQGGVDVYDAAT